MASRLVKSHTKSRPTLEEAGVRLRRAFGFGSTCETDPFLLVDDGDEIVIEACGNGIRFLLAAEKPLGEPVAWHGPIVMNTEAELRQAIAALENRTFLKRSRSPE